MQNKDQRSSWPGIAVRRTASLALAYARPSTSCFAAKKGVDARHKAGHDVERIARTDQTSRQVTPSAAVAAR
jgi:hypothetical protein